MKQVPEPKWHKSGWEVWFGRAVKEPRCRCSRCEFRLFCAAREAIAKLSRIYPSETNE